MVTRNPAPTNPVAGEDWNLWRSFIAVVETGSLSRAAVRVAMTQPSLSRHIRQLEKQAGETLFERLPSGLEPTARGRAMYELVSGMQELARRARSFVEEPHDEVAGVVRVTTSEPFGIHELPRWLTELMHAEPALEIELRVTQETENLLRRDADIAVRFVQPLQDGVIAKRVGRVRLGLYASQAYLAARGEPRSFGDVAHGHVLIGPDRLRPPAGTPAGALLGGLKLHFRTDAVLARLAAIEAGMGIGPCLVHLAETRPALRRVFAAQVNLPMDIWLCGHDDLRRSTRLRRVFDHLDAKLLEAFDRGP